MIDEHAQAPASVGRVTASAARVREVVEALPLAVFEADPDGRLRYTSPAWESITGVSRDLLATRRITSLAHPHDREAVERALARATTGTEAVRLEIRITRPDGSLRALDGMLRSDRDEHGRVRALVGYISDASPRRAEQEASTRLAAIIELTDEFVGVTDADGGIAYLNRAARERLGLVGRDVARLTTADLFAPRTFERYYDEIRPTLLRGEGWSGELELLDVEGRVVRAWVSVVAGTGPGGEVEWLATIGREVTHSIAHDAALARRVGHDGVTGLPDSSGLMAHLERALDRSPALSVLVVDPGRVGELLRGLATEASDAVMREVAARVQRAVRPADLVARVDQAYVVVCEDITEAGAVAVATRVTAAIAERPFATGRGALALVGAVGLSMSDGSVDAPTLLQEATIAATEARGLPRAGSRPSLVVADDELRRRVRAGSEVAHQLAIAVAQSEVQVLYQPVVDLRTGTAVGFEAVPVWDHPEWGRLPSGQLLKLADESALAVPLGLQLLRRACRQARAWEQHLGQRPPRVHVDVPLALLATDDFPRMLTEILGDAGLDGWNLCLEVPDAVLGPAGADAGDALHRLRRLGVALAVDGFGAGAADLGALRDADCDVLKLAPQLLEEMSQRNDRGIVTAAVEIAHALEAWAIAEGVQTQAQAGLLRDMGCDAAQGGHFAAPVSATAAGPMLNEPFDAPI